MKNTKIFLDTADIKKIIIYNKNKYISGFTTNPSLMKKSGIKNYKSFVKYLSAKITKPLSFEIFSDNYKEIIYQAKVLNSFSKNIYVKIPIMNSKGKYLTKEIKKISELGIKTNITAVFTKQQFARAYKSVGTNTKSIISVFAGRVADTGKDPVKLIKDCQKINKRSNVKILWASTREVFNIYQASACKCDIITVSPEIFDKLKLKNFNLIKYSKITSSDFIKDAKKLKLKL